MKMNWLDLSSDVSPDSIPPVEIIPSLPPSNRFAVPISRIGGRPRDPLLSSAAYVQLEAGRMDGFQRSGLLDAGPTCLQMGLKELPAYGNRKNLPNVFSFRREAGFGYMEQDLRIWGSRTTSEHASTSTRLASPRRNPGLISSGLDEKMAWGEPAS
jgi:hypothetical protein